MSTTKRAAAIILSIVLGGCGTSIAPSPSPAATAVTTAVPVTDAPPTAPPTPAASPGDPRIADLDGVLTSPELAHRLPLVVSIDDASVARPQSGFNAASIVWQAPADGFETRYLMVFQEGDASAIGPVRSARNYLALWTAELDAAFGHYGGDLLSRTWMTANRGVLFTDVDGLGAGNSAYHRISSRDAPHNAYTNTTDLRNTATRLGADPLISPAVHLRPFRDDLPAASRGTKQALSVPYNTVKIRYEYEPATNAYRRLVNGVVQTDQMDRQRVTARTVVVLFMPFRTDSTIEKGHNRPVLGFIGAGDAWVYSEGTLVKGSWSKPTSTDPTVILGPDGTELPFVRGRIFMQVVPLGTKIGA
ncbi:MAG: DUF3048 domain-containing protein [Chloroflexota bacterium]